MTNVDYHVGLLRGFLLAHNAHQSLLHALDCVLTHTRLAGEVICEPKKQDIEELGRIAQKAEQEAKKNVVPAVEKKHKYTEEEADTVRSSFQRWNRDEEKIIQDAHDDEKTTKQMIALLPHKSYNQIYAKQVAMGLSPHGRKREEARHEEMAD